MGQYFPKPYEPFDGDINVRADLSNYGTKADLENATEIDTSKVAEKFDKITHTKVLVKKLNYNAKITEIENKIPSTRSLAKTSSLTSVENKIPSISSLVKETDYNVKISEIEKKLTHQDHNKYITTPEFNNLAARVFDARLAQANLVTKIDFDDKQESLNQKINSNKTNHLLVQNKFKKLQTFD